MLSMFAVPGQWMPAGETARVGHIEENKHCQEQA